MKYLTMFFGAGLALSAVAQVPTEILQKIEDTITETVREEYAQNRVARRDAHAKHHGCVHATFQVNESLPKDLQVGPFQPGKTYPAWIRYSNGGGQVRSDREGDARGMAIKIVGVPGAKLLEDERNELTHDFVLINYPAFFVKTAADYVGFAEAVAKYKSPLRYFFPGWNPLNWHLREANIGRKITRQKVGNLTDIAYFSMTPYRFGNRVVKYTAKPCAAIPTPPRRLPDSPNYLRETLAKSLSQRSACFEFFVQPQGAGMPVEDSTVIWSETESRPRKVATITIPKQDFTSPAQDSFCENLSFTPWHALPELQPLGEINEVRKVVYQAVSKLRHRLNGAERREPTGNERF